MSALAYSQPPLAADLFDAEGRCVPQPSSGAPMRTRHYFHCRQPEVDLSAIYQRASRHLGQPQIDEAEFARRIDALRVRLAADARLAGLLCGVAVPFLLPRAPVDDLSSKLSQHYLPAVASAFAERFPQYRFVNHHPVEPELAVVSGSRHEQLLTRLAQEDVVGYWFAALGDYSLPGGLQQVKSLPGDVLLSGGFDTAAALIACPELLLREDGYPPLLWLAALRGQRADAAYHFEAYGYNLTFNYRPHFNQTAEYWCSGLVVLA